MPAAPTNTRASAQANSGPVNWVQGGVMGSNGPSAYVSGAKQRHSSRGAYSDSLARSAMAQPRRLNARMASFMALPPSASPPPGPAPGAGGFFRSSPQMPPAGTARSGTVPAPTRPAGTPPRRWAGRAVPPRPPPPGPGPPGNPGRSPPAPRRQRASPDAGGGGTQGCPTRRRR